VPDLVASHASMLMPFCGILCRHYRVRRAKLPGTFYFSVLDNGVTSNEYWRIVDCAEDLSWLLFYYTGAAAAAGQSYSGAILVTPDGDWPPNRETYEARLEAALDKAGIKFWEVSSSLSRGEGIESGCEVVCGMYSYSRFAIVAAKARRWMSQSRAWRRLWLKISN
jgi:hypothetical protein